MSEFPMIPPLLASKIVGGSRTYELAEKLEHGRGEVPEGYVTDGASIPRIFWSIFPKDGPYLAAAIIHDYDYTDGEGSRLEADKAFYQNMKATGVGWLSRQLIYRAVRIGGGDTWERNRGGRDFRRGRNARGRRRR